MNKSEIRKKILDIRRKKNYKNFIINPKTILRILNKEKIKGKVLGGYYPYNYEVDVLQIIEKLEKQKYKISCKFTAKKYL